MVLGHWDLSHQLCHLTMVDTAEARAMGVLIATVEITPGSDTEMMTVIHLTSPREPRIMTLDETLIMTPDQRRIHDSVRVAILMMRRKMIENDSLS